MKQMGQNISKFMNLGQGYMGVLELFQFFCNFEIMSKEKVANRHTRKCEHMIIFLFSCFSHSFNECIFFIIKT